LSVPGSQGPPRNDRQAGCFRSLPLHMTRHVGYCAPGTTF